MASAILFATTIQGSSDHQTLARQSLDKYTTEFDHLLENDLTPTYEQIKGYKEALNKHIDDVPHHDINNYQEALITVEGLKLGEVITSLEKEPNITIANLKDLESRLEDFEATVRKYGGGEGAQEAIDASKEFIKQKTKDLDDPFLRAPTSQVKKADNKTKPDEIKALTRQLGPLNAQLLDIKQLRANLANLEQDIDDASQYPSTARSPSPTPPVPSDHNLPHYDSDDDSDDDDDGEERLREEERIRLEEEQKLLEAAEKEKQRIQAAEKQAIETAEKTLEAKVAELEADNELTEEKIEELEQLLKDQSEKIPKKAKENFDKKHSKKVDELTNKLHIKQAVEREKNRIATKTQELDAAAKQLGSQLPTADKKYAKTLISNYEKLLKDAPKGIDLRSYRGALLDAEGRRLTEFLIGEREKPASQEMHTLEKQIARYKALLKRHEGTDPSYKKYITTFEDWLAEKKKWQKDPDYLAWVKENEAQAGPPAPSRGPGVGTPPPAPPGTPPSSTPGTGGTIPKPPPAPPGTPPGTRTIPPPPKGAPPTTTAPTSPASGVNALLDSIRKGTALKKVPKKDINDRSDAITPPASTAPGTPPPAGPASPGAPTDMIDLLKSKLATRRASMKSRELVTAANFDDDDDGDSPYESDFKEEDYRLPNTKVELEKLMKKVGDVYNSGFGADYKKHQPSWVNAIENALKTATDVSSPKPTPPPAKSKTEEEKLEQDVESLEKGAAEATIPSWKLNMLQQRAKKITTANGYTEDQVERAIAVIKKIEDSAAPKPAAPEPKAADPAPATPPTKRKIDIKALDKDVQTLENAAAQTSPLQQWAVSRHKKTADRITTANGYTEEQVTRAQEAIAKIEDSAAPKPKAADDDQAKAKATNNGKPKTTNDAAQPASPPSAIKLAPQLVKNQWEKPESKPSAGSPGIAEIDKKLEALEERIKQNKIQWKSIEKWMDQFDLNKEKLPVVDNPDIKIDDIQTPMLPPKLYKYWYIKKQELEKK